MQNDLERTRNPAPGIDWKAHSFDLLSARQWHDILSLRARVFVVEQACAYQDPDEKDPLSWHITASEGLTLVGTLRALPPGLSYAEASLGRVVINPEFRGLALGQALMQRGIALCGAAWGGDIRLSAQVYLLAFYKALGFESVGEPYLEDDIPHIEMLLRR